jgi:peroxiredoxin
MKRMIQGLALSLAVLAIPAAAPADLPMGAIAPQFVTVVASKGKAINFNLSKELRKGPVVVYFYPKSFTDGCSLEAHAFAEAAGDFKAAGATLVGLSADTIQDQLQFSKKECGDKFKVGVATPQIISAYDVHLKKKDGTLTGLASRTSYVIAKGGKVVLAYTDMNPNQHVARTLAAVRALRAKR